MSGFVWGEYNSKEFEECGLSEYQREIALKFLTVALRALTEKHKGEQIDAKTFFAEAHHNAQVALINEMPKRMNARDYDFVRSFDNILHALAHYTGYVYAEYEYQRSAAAFEAAVAELIG